MVEEGEVLRPIFALHITSGLSLRIRAQPLLLILPPQIHRVAPVRIVRLRARNIHRIIITVSINMMNIVWLWLQLNGEPLVVATRGALQLVHSGQSPKRHGVELAAHALAAPGEIEEEGDPVGPADEREFLCCAVAAHQGRVSGSHQLLHQRVVGETPLQGPVREDQVGSTLIISNLSNHVFR